MHPMLKVWLRTEFIPVRRTKDEATGLDLLDLPVRLAQGGSDQGSSDQGGA